jgi:hypothetical protein
MKIVVFSYDAAIVIALSIRYDECRPHKTGLLCAADRLLKTKKKLSARRASEKH